MSFDFANILFGGPCNRACPFCIGKQLPGRLQQDNLDLFPLRNLDAFVEAVKRHDIRQIVFTGTVTDPQLYKHEARLLEHLRERLPGTLYSLHSNGVKALQKMDVFNLYDKACLSIPSFHPDSYEKMMGSRKIPDLARIVEWSNIEVKVSILINEINIDEVDQCVQHCRKIGVPRVVLRRLYGETRTWNVMQGYPIVRTYRGNPVYDVDGMEVTYWNFDTTQSKSINLFPDGTLSQEYLLTRFPSEPKRTDLTCSSASPSARS